METRASVLTISDTRTPETDLSGAAAELALAELGIRMILRHIVTDDIEAIQGAIIDLSAQSHVVITTGGTGFGPRDVTPEATSPLLDRRADNLSELIRFRGLEHTEFSHLSRGISGMRGRCLIVNLPGSPKAVTQGIAAISHLLLPILSNVQGHGCPV